MPSAKDPTTTVLPGPGNIPDGTVSASSLNFNPSAGAEAALAAHITNPTGAHEDSAISTDALGGSFHWAAAAGSVESALGVVFNAINARGMVVLDANPAATDADYAGPNALITAYSLTPANNKSVFYLRPGVYNWTNPAILSGVTIIGGGSPDTAVANTQVEIQNLAGNFRFGGGSIVRNVLLTCSGSIQMPTGGNTFENVAFKTTTAQNIVSTKNVFRQCGTYIPGAVPTSWTDSGGSNHYDSFNVEQMIVSGGSCSFHNLTIGSTVAPATPGFNLLDVASANNSFTSLSILTTSAVTSNALNVSGSNNVFNGVLVQGLNTTASAVYLTGSGIGSAITGLRITGSTCGVNIVRLESSASAIRNVYIATTSISSPASAIDLNTNNCHLDSVFLQSLSGSVTSLLTISGAANVVRSLNSTTGGSSTLVNFSSVSRACELHGFVAQSIVSTAGVALINMSGKANKVSGVSLNGLSTLACAVLRVFTAEDCSAQGFTMTNLSVSAGSGFSLAVFESSSNCTVGGFDVSSSANMATTSGLLRFRGDVRGCVVDGVHLSSVGTGAAVNSPILVADNFASGVNTMCTVRNVVSTSSVFAASTVLFSVAQNLWSSLTIEKCDVQESISGATVVSLVGVAAPSTDPPTVIQDCVFSNPHASASHAVRVGFFGARTVFQRCSLSAGGTGTVSVEGSLNVKFLDCQIDATGVSTIAGSAPDSGTTFERCVFQGPNAGTSASGVQLFNGSGGSVPTRALVIKDCTMVVGPSNCATAATTMPLVFLGGEGTTAASFVPTVVDGLLINTELLIDWHPGPTLAVACNTRTLQSSSFDNITVDLAGNRWSVAGTNCSVFPTDINTSGAVVEISGIDPTVGTAFGKPSFRNLAIRGLSNDGEGPRHIVKALGCSISGLSIDGSNSPPFSSYSANAITLKYATLRESHLFIGGSALSAVGVAVVKADTGCTIENVLIDHLNAVSTNPLYVFDLSASILRGCRIYVNTARPDNVIRVLGDYSHVEDNFIVQTGSVALGSSAISVTTSHNVISGNIFQTSAPTVGVDIFGGNGNVIRDNRFVYAISGTIAAIRSRHSGGSGANYNRILNNNVEKTNATSTGLAFIQLDGGNWCQVSDNIVLTHLSSGSQQSAIFSTCYMAKITDNTCHNTHTTNGTIGITSTGDYSNVSGNRIWCKHGSFATAAFINATGNNQTIVANHVENNDGGNSGTISTGASFLPTPVASYNQLT